MLIKMWLHPLSAPYFMPYFMKKWSRPIMNMGESTFGNLALKESQSWKGFSLHYEQVKHLVYSYLSHLEDVYPIPPIIFTWTRLIGIG